MTIESCVESLPSLNVIQVKQVMWKGAPGNILEPRATETQYM
jgi:hypothetical protein